MWPWAPDLRSRCALARPGHERRDRVDVLQSTGMTEARPTFDDGAAYDEFMGRWSRAVGAVFLDWLAAPGKAAWLDVGCGTGAFTTLIVKTCKPARVSAVDPGSAQIEFARRQPVAKRADFRVADVQALPFSDATFDVVASALVINFIPDRARGVAEMRRVTRPYGMVGGYVWDFAADRSPSWPFNRAFSGLGIEPPQLPGAPEFDARRAYRPVRGRGPRRHRHPCDRGDARVQGLRHLLAHPDAAHASRRQAGRGDGRAGSRRADGRGAGASARGPGRQDRLRRTRECGEGTRAEVVCEAFSCPGRAQRDPGPRGYTSGPAITERRQARAAEPWAPARARA